MASQVSLIWKIQQRPITMFIAIAILTLLAISGFERLKLDIDFSDYFSPADKRYMAQKSMSEQFERHDQLWMMLETSEDWRQQSLQTQLIEFIGRLEANSDISSIQGYNQFIQGLAHTDKILSYKTHPRLASVLSANGQAILLRLQIEPPQAVAEQNALTQSQWLDNVLQKIDSDSQQYWQVNSVNIYLNGTHALNWQYAKVLRHDLSWFAPGLLGIIFIMAALFIRQKMWVVGLCLNNGLTLVLTLGLAAWCQLTLAAISAFVPVIIVTLGLAYAAHLYFGWQAQINAGKTAQQALSYTVKVNQAPLFYSSITTIFGFSLLTLSPSPPIQSFGLLVAFAVLCNYLLSLTSLVFFAKYAKAKHEPILNFDKVIQLGKFNAKRPLAVMLGIVLFSVLSLMSVAKLTLNDDPLSYFSSANPFTVSSQKMSQYFSGINLQHYVIAGLEPKQIDKAEVSFIYKFSRYLKLQPQVVDVQHIGDWIKAAGIGQTQFRQILAQNSVADLRLQSELSADKYSTLLTLYLQPMTAMELIQFEQKVNTWLAEHATSVDVSPPLGSNLQFAHLSIDNANNMLLSFAVALIALAILLSILKKSCLFGFMGLLLNFLPLLWVFAVWQLNGGFISLGTAVVLGMMLGIIVDDTLHLMLKLPDEQTMTTAMMWHSLQKVLPVISFTTLTIALGFSLGLVSAFTPIAQLSLLSCLVVIFAWGFDVLMLPVLFQRWLINKQTQKSLD
ncbi:RND transporter [Shewanella sairae]|uniref:RND transporter n=1 Tax=Shewanella sairae TaxID=190310 RepID=A0ABQ4PMY0_9GAMM|nr:MMPL family transporter [Shewanella sairae]MCL1131926.1 MMPL family transporter [Shewanella sairae]GIU49408.1 RND transporter [Shewanella sairae]